MRDACRFSTPRPTARGSNRDIPRGIAACSQGFDFEGTHTCVVPNKTLAHRMSDGREVTVEFAERPGGVQVTETFDPETENTPELQRQGWQAILDNFKRHVEAKTS